MDNNQYNGQYQQNYGQSQPYNNMQQNYDQSQPYNDMQQGYIQYQPDNGQFQQNYGQPYNMQSGYGQPQPYNMQQGYESQMQPQYGNVGQGYGQPQVNYDQQIYPTQNQGYPNGITPGKQLVINKKFMIIAAAVVAVILAIIFIPKIFKKAEPPFENIKFGLSVEEVKKKYDVDSAYSVDAYKHDVEGFGVKGSGQFCFYLDELNQVNWYVYEDECDEDDYEKAFDLAKEYYTDEYGKPDKEEDYDDAPLYVWEVDNKNEIQLADHDDYFVLRYVYHWYK